MAGLMNNAGAGMPPQQPQQQPMPNEGQEQLPAGYEQATPEEQAAYEEYVSNGMQLMYSEEALPRIMESLKGDGNPIEGLANTMSMVALRLDQTASEQGKEIEGYIKFQGATEILEQLAELGEQAGIHEYNEQDMESALMIALDIYRNAQEQQGGLPKEQLEQDMEMLMQAEEQGTIDQVLPGIEEYAQKHAQQGQPPGQPPSGPGGQPKQRPRRGLMG